MFGRVSKLVVWCVAVAMALMPALVSANQAKLKGYLFTRPAFVKDTTGSCQCVWKWYTVGLRPGVVRVTATLRGDGPVQAPTYAVLVSLLNEGSSMMDGQVSCDAKQRNCGKRVTLTARIKSAGPYYIFVHGEGSISIFYSLRVQGPVYALRCKTYCR